MLTATHAPKLLCQSEHMHAVTHARTPTGVQALTHIRARSRTHIRAHVCMHARTPTHAHRRLRTQKRRARVQASTHARIATTRSSSFMCSRVCSSVLRSFLPSLQRLLVLSRPSPPLKAFSSSQGLLLLSRPSPPPKAFSGHFACSRVSVLTSASPATSVCISAEAHRPVQMQLCTAFSTRASVPACVFEGVRPIR